MVESQSLVTCGLAYTPQVLRKAKMEHVCTLWFAGERNLNEKPQSAWSVLNKVLVHV